MDDKEMPFSTVDIVFLVIIGLVNDGLEIFFDLLAASVVGLPGEAIMEPIDFVFDCIVTAWFFMKCGFGGPALAQILDDILEIFGVPGRTICIGVGVYVANHPGSFLATAGQVAATIGTGGEAAIAEEAGSLAMAAKTAEEAGAAAGTAMKTEEGVAAAGGEARSLRRAGGETTSEHPRGTAGGEGEGVGVGEGEGVGEEEAGEEGAEQETREKAEKEMEAGGEISPEEEAAEEDFGQTSQQTEQASEQEGDEDKEEHETDEGDAEQLKPSNNVVSIDEGKKKQRAEAVKQNLEHLKAAHSVTGEDEDKDSGNEEGADEEEMAA